MRRLIFWTLAVFAVSASAGFGATLSPRPAGTTKACGTILHTELGSIRVSASRRLACADARKVVDDFLTHGGRFVGTDHADGYTIVDRNWHCTLFMGYSRCTRVGTHLVATGAPSPAGTGKIASACSTETLGGSHHVPRITYRFVLHGNATCAEAHSTMRAYISAAEQGRCPTRICDQVFSPGGWTCGSSSPVEAQMNGGLLAGCSHRGGSFTVYRASNAGLQRCANETVDELDVSKVAVTLRFALHKVSCAKAHSLIRAYFQRESTPGYCASHGNICYADFAGGWTCSFPVAASEGDFAGCAQPATGARVKVFQVGA